MFKAAAALLLALPGLSCAAELHISGFGGVNNYADPMFIADTDASDARNVITYEGDLRPVYGSVRFNTVAASSITYLGEYVNSDGRRTVFSKSGLGLYATNPNTGVMTLLKAFDSEREIDAVPAFGAMYFVDGSSAWWSDGVSTYTATNMSACDYVEFYANRLVCVSVSTETSRMNLSAYNSSTTWATGSGDDDAAVRYFAKDDGYQINCVKATPYGIFVGKDRSSHILKGDSNPTFYQFPLSDTIGCSDDRSVQFVDGVIMWLGNKGNVYGWAGDGRVEDMSAEIRGWTKDIRKSQSQEGNWTVASQAGWELGAYSGWETTADPSVLKARSYNSGLLTSGATSYFLPTMFANSGFENGTSSGWTPAFGAIESQNLTWCSGTSCTPTLTSGRTYSAFTSCSSKWMDLPRARVDVINASDDAVIFSYELFAACDSPSVAVQQNISSPTISGSGDIKIRIFDIDGSTRTSTAFDRSNGVFLMTKSDYTGVRYDSMEGKSAIETSVSQVYDTGFVAPDLSLSIYASYGSTLTYYASADSSTWVSTTIAIGGSVPTDYKLRYFKFNISMTASGAGVVYSSFTGITLSMLDTATYYSPVTFTSVGISDWKQFVAAYTSTATTPVFSVRSGTYAFASDGAAPAWTVQSNGGEITISTGAYVQYAIDPKITSSTQALAFQSTSINYVVGAVSPRVASLTWDGHYLLSVSTNSETTNHLTLMYQKNKKWTALEGQSYGAMTVYNNRPLAGDGTSGSRLWYLLDQDAKSFDGAAINSWWQTKDYTLGSVNNHKVIDRMWINAGGNGVDALDISWQADRAGTWYSTSTALSGTSFVIREVDGLFENYNLARQARFKFAADEIDRDFRLKMFSLYYTVNPLIK